MLCNPSLVQNLCNDVATFSYTSTITLNQGLFFLQILDQPLKQKYECIAFHSISLLNFFFSIHKPNNKRSPNMYIHS